MLYDNVTFKKNILDHTFENIKNKRSMNFLAYPYFRVRVTLGLVRVRVRVRARVLIHSPRISISNL